MTEKGRSSLFSGDFKDEKAFLPISSLFWTDFEDEVPTKSRWWHGWGIFVPVEGPKGWLKHGMVS